MIKSFNLKKVLAIFLSVLMLLSMFWGAFSSVLANLSVAAQNVNILSGNTSGTLYRIGLETPLSQGGEAPATHTFKDWASYVATSTKFFNTYTKVNNSWTLGNQETQLDYLTTEDNTTEVRIQDRAGGDYSLKNRVGILYDLGAKYDLSTLKLTVNNTNQQIRKFAVYASNSIDTYTDILNNCVGTGGSSTKTDTELSAELTDADGVQYLMIVFEHVSNSDTVSKYAYYPELLQIECFEKIKELPPENTAKNILEDNTTGTLYRIGLEIPLSQGGEAPSTHIFKDWASYVATSTKFFNTYTKVNNSWTLGNQETQLDYLTTKDNTTEVRIQDRAGGDYSLKNRVGILYDLGAKYDLSTLKLTVNNTNQQIRKFAVYASNSIDTYTDILNNCVGTGGSSIKTDTELSAELNDADGVQYLMIVFEHVSNADTVSKYAYYPELLQIECFEKNKELPPLDDSINSVIEGNTTGTIYRLGLEDALTQDGTIPNTLTYKDWAAYVSTSSKFFNTQTKKDNVWTFGDTETQLDYLTTKDNTTDIRIEAKAGGDYSLNNRVGILYDLGENYDLTRIKLTVDNSENSIYRFSVYVGNSIDISILENCVGVGGSSTKSDTELTAELKGANGVSYLMIVFDHVSNSETVNKYAYTPVLSKIECVGEISQEIEIESILTGNSTGRLYSIQLKNPYVTGEVPSINYSELKYGNLKLATDIKYSYRAILDGTIAEDQDAAMKLLTTKDNTTEVKFEHTAGGSKPLSYRMAIMYDLGAKYDLTKLTLKVNNSSNQIRNYSVYAGNIADATIFEKRIGIGGSDDKDVTNLDSILENANGVQYIIIVFDHVSSVPESNQYTYLPKLMQINCYGEKSANQNDDIVTGPQSILEDNATGKLYSIELSTPYIMGSKPEIDYTKLKYDNLKLATDIKYSYRALVDGIIAEDQEAAMKLLTTKDNTTEVKFEHTAGGSKPLSYRMGIVYDLGAKYDLTKISLKVNNVEHQIRNYSVYAGNEVKATLFERRIGIGGSDDTDAINLDSELENANGVQYIIIVFDHVSNVPESNQYTYLPKLMQVSCYGEKSTNQNDDIDKGPKSILENNKTGRLYSIILENPYKQWDEKTPFAIDYTSLKYTNLTLAERASKYPFKAQTKIDKKWTDGSESQNLALLTTPDNTTEVRIQHSGGGNAPLKYRVGILYELNDWYDLTEISLEVNNFDQQIRNFSVYAGATSDSIIFKNRVGIGGSEKKGTNTIGAELNGAKQVKYLLIVFDHVSNFEGVNKYSYIPQLTQINCYGTKTTAPDLSQVGYGQNILLNNKSGRVYQVNYSVPHDSKFVPDYSKLKYTNLFDNNTRYKRFGTSFNVDGKNKDAINDPELVYLTDGKIDKNVTIQYAAKATDGFIEEKRMAILYDLGEWYDLSTVLIKQDLTSGRAVRNYSVYAGAFKDSRLLNCFVGHGGGLYESLPAELSNAKSVRYLLIVFDNITLSSSELANIYAYMPTLNEIECYGKINKNPIIPIDNKSTDLLEKIENVKVNMVYIDHKFSWADSFDKGSYNYQSKDFSLQAELNSSTWDAWTDGDSGSEGYWSLGRGKKENLEKRLGLLIDLGDFYDLNELELDSSPGAWSSGRYLYDFTVYGGSVADGSILKTLIGHGGSKEQLNTVELKSQKSVRYLLIVFNKMGTDPGNTKDDDVSASGGNKIDCSNALPGCTWADAGIYLGEISLFGKIGKDHTSTVTYTDPDSGVKVEIVTYDNNVLIEKIRIVRNPVNEIHKGTIKLDAMYVLGDSYKIEFLDKHGKIITDMSGRQFSVWFPMKYGDEVVYGINSDNSLSIVDSKLDMMNNSLVYTTTTESQIFGFIIASYTDPNSETLANNGDKEYESNKNNILIYTLIIAGSIVIISGVTLLVIFLLKRKKISLK